MIQPIATSEPPWGLTHLGTMTTVHSHFYAVARVVVAAWRGRLPRVITLDGYQASHRAAREALNEHPCGNRTKIRSSKYLNNLIEQDHRSIKLRLGPMLGLKQFRSSLIVIAGVEFANRIRKG